MGQEYEQLEPDCRMIGRQHVMFIATAPADTNGHVNVSPKGIHDTFRILDPKHVGYIDLVGSGIETVAHLKENGRHLHDVVRLRGSSRGCAGPRARTCAREGVGCVR